MYNVRNEGLADFFDYLKHHVCQLTVYTAYISYMISFSQIWSRLVCYYSCGMKQTENAVSLQLFASGMMALSKVAGDGASLANSELYFLFGFSGF
jgi:hypothetical protein